jgi:short-subunit dehydrogenase
LPSVLILGATSGIARAVAVEFARHNYDLILAGRDRRELDATAADLAIRFAVQTHVCCFDVLDFDAHPAAVASCFAEAGADLEGAVLAIGYLGDEPVAQNDFAEARRILDTNLTGCVSALNILARHFESRGSGFICALSSVAGDRGRQSNYHYGAAKAGLSVYLQGLRNRLYHCGVQVTTIKPGFVDTAMTFGRPGLFLVASPEYVARRILRAIKSHRDVMYIPWFWRGIMWAIRNVPESLFKRLRL